MRKLCQVNTFTSLVRVWQTFQVGWSRRAGSYPSSSSLHWQCPLRKIRGCFSLADQHTHWLLSLCDTYQIKHLRRRHAEEALHKQNYEPPPDSVICSETCFEIGPFEVNLSIATYTSLYFHTLYGIHGA